jgi:anti-sigma B factor antagonist
MNPALDRFGIQDRREGERHMLVLQGALDMAAAPKLESTLQQLCEGGASELVLDLGRLEFIDSTGLSAIIRGAMACEARACRLSLLPGREAVQRVFELTGLIDRLPFHGAGAAERV